MNKFILPALIVLATFACVATIIHNHPFTVQTAKTQHAEAITGDAEDIEDYVKWEQQRLADPATGQIPYNIRNLELTFASGLPNDAHSNNGRISNSTWNERGPWNVGGRTRSFAADVKNEGILLAGTTSGGMWRSADSGKTWSLTTNLAIQQGVSCLAQDRRLYHGHSNVWFYGSGECYGQSASGSGVGSYYLGNGVYRSTDNGQTWSSLPSTALNNVQYVSNWEGIWSIATDTSAPDSLCVVYASMLEGFIARSVDSGRTWTNLFGSPTSGNGYYTNVIVTPHGVVYATISSDGSQKGIWRSADGLHFHNITPPGFPVTYNRIVMNYSPANDSQLYFLANTPGYGMPDTNFQKQVEWNSLWKYTYISGDGDSAGGKWIDLSANLPHTGSMFDKYNCQGSYDMAVSFLPTDTSTVFIGGTDIFRSTSGFFDASHTAHIGGYGVGATLPDIKVYPGSHPDQHVFFSPPSNPLVMYTGCDGGLFKTYNDTAANVQWHTFDSGYITTMFYTVTSNHAMPGSNLLVAGAQDNDCLFDNSTALTNKWTKPIFGDGSFCYIADSGKTFYYEITTGKLFKVQMDTLNGTVAAFNRIDPIGGKNYEWLNPYQPDPNNNNMMYFGGGKYLWRNDNLSAIPYSNMWDSISTNWVKWTDSVPLNGQYITAIAVSTIPANRVYYGTSYQRVYRVDNANSGTPVPVDITEKTGVNMFPGGYVDCIAVDPDSADRAIVVFSNYAVRNLFLTNNGGASWSRIGGNLNGANQPSLRWAAIQHLSSGDTIYWVAASTGLYATNHLLGNSTVWVQQGVNTIGNAVCDMVDIRPGDGLVAVATHARGVYTANITSVSQIASVQPETAPAVAGINLTAYPNPFNQQAYISFTLPDERFVQLSIYDIQGRLVKQMANSDMQQGPHIVSFEASGNACGIYFCRLQAGNEVRTIRMALTR